MASAANKPSEGAEPGPGKENENEVKRTDGPVSEASTPQSSTSNPRILKRASTTSLVQTTSSPGSPKASRETSPVRPPLRSGVSANSGNPRSRKNSTDLSPNRGPVLPGPIVPAVPSAAAIQRALSVAGAHQLQPSTNPDLNADPARPQKVIKTAHANNNPSASNLPRVRSPPPLTPNKGAVHALRKPDPSTPPTLTPSIVVDRSNRAPNPNVENDAAASDISASTAMKIPQRGSSGTQSTLETVQESSVPPTPALGTAGPNATQHGMTKAASDRRPERIDEDPQEDVGEKGLPSRPESGNESSGSKNAAKEEGQDAKKQDALKTSATRPQVVHPKKSLTQLHPAKGKTAAEGSVKSMTVETETVSSIPQVALGGGTGERGLPGRTDTGGNLRLKPSTETIRPKKEKKRVVRKAPSLNAGTGGLPSFRRFHHHHPFSRAPSPEQVSPLSFTSPESTPALVSDTSDAGSSSLRSLDLVGARLQVTSVDSRPLYPDPSRRSSLSALTSGRGRVASSKSDIFEARVASAVDEANSSDSEETFVYESNPPEPLLTRPHRFHSRTPSATSMASQIDQYGARVRQDGHHSIAGKKSMKFANNSYHSTNYPNEAGDASTAHGPNQSTRGTPIHHRHIGQYGRNGHTSLFDNESPFPNATKPLRTPVSSTARLSPRPSSPRSPHILKVSGSSRKSGEPLLYDLEGEGADDERTPLVGSARSGRIRINRRAAGGSRNGYVSEDEKRQRACRTVTVYTSLATLMAALIAAVIIIMVMCSKSLVNVRIKDIRNVLASEQEIMVDLHVHAVNPNLVAVQVSDLDINIFAKSKHVGTGEMWRNRGSRPLGGHDVSTMVPAVESGRPRISALTSSTSSLGTRGIDEGTDPIADPETDAQTMLLGRIFEFDSPLIFDPSPLHHYPFSSIGEVRLAHPGNKTEEGGSDRWEKVLQYDFELIVRGVIKYGLPLSSVKRKASVGASVLVQVTKDKDDDEGRGSNTLLRRPGRGWWHDDDP
ncbi:MAG: hypothetical protein Q9216_005487 [Gyalolechia sp. 2 TL-2023]